MEMIKLTELTYVYPDFRYSDKEPYWKETPILINKEVIQCVCTEGGQTVVCIGAKLNSKITVKETVDEVWKRIKEN